MVNQLYQDVEVHSSSAGLLGRNASVCTKVKQGKKVILACGSIALTLVGITYLAIQYQSHEDITRPIGPPDPLLRRPTVAYIKSAAEPDALVQDKHGRLRKNPDILPALNYSSSSSNAQDNSNAKDPVSVDEIDKPTTTTSPPRATRYFRGKDDPPPPKPELPKNAADKDPISLINEMRASPDYTFVPCINGGNKKLYTAVTVGFEAKLVMEGQNFTAYAKTKKVGKKEVAIRACKYFWNLDFKMPENENSDLVKETCAEMRRRQSASQSEEHRE